ncbi:hypothetical protein BC826DRAFT_972939 [Russula brevipes]|nr:hypothetical protein BC826DRAFT_972939 [Russula brevipes]
MSVTQPHCPEFQTATPVPQIRLVVKSKVADGRLIVVTSGTKAHRSLQQSPLINYDRNKRSRGFQPISSASEAHGCEFAGIGGRLGKPRFAAPGCGLAATCRTRLRNRDNRFPWWLAIRGLLLLLGYNAQGKDEQKEVESTNGTIVDASKSS